MLAVASGLVHALSKDIYVNPTYFYMNGSVEDGFDYVSEPEVISHKIYAYEKGVGDLFRQIKHVSSSKGMVGVYVTHKPYEVHIISFSKTSR